MYPRTNDTMKINIIHRLGVEDSPSPEDDQQSGEHFPSGSSSELHEQLYGVTDLWLVQLPTCRQDVPTQHPRHSALSRLVCPHR